MLKKLNKKYIFLAIFFVVIHALFIVYVTSIPPTIHSSSMPYELVIEYELFLLVTLMLPLLIPSSIGLPVFANVPFMAIPNVLGHIYLVIFWFLIYWLFISIFFKITHKLTKFVQK